MHEYEVTMKRRRKWANGGIEPIMVRYVLSAPNLREAKAFAWEIYKESHKVIERREMFRIDVSRIYQQHKGE